MRKNGTFEDGNLVLASFSDQSFDFRRFRGCNLTETDLQGIKAVDLSFERCRFEGTEFSQASVSSGMIRDSEILSLSGIAGLSGITIDVPAMMAQAHALALAAGLKVVDASSRHKG